MSFAFDLKIQDEGSYATIYSFRKEGEERTEIEKFWAKPDVQQAPDHDALRTRLYVDVLHRHNFTHESCFHGKYRWFRDESDPADPEDVRAEALCAPIPAKDRKNLPEPYPSLRLYCFRKRQILIAGNGGVKEVRRQQDDPELLAAWNDLRYVMRRVHERIEWERTLEIVEDGYLLDGNRHFDQPDYP
jgi:hypothetical protein